MSDIYLKNRAAVLVVGEDIPEDVCIPRTCNVLVSDELTRPVSSIESQVVGRELHLNKEQFSYVRQMIFGDVASELQLTSGRWLFTRCSNSESWLLKLAMKLEDSEWDGCDVALALICYQHAAWCDGRFEWAADADDCCDAAMMMHHVPAVEVRRVRERLAHEGFYLNGDPFDFQGDEDIVELRIPDYTSIIPAGAFRGCHNLRSVYIPDSVVEVGEGAFEDCPNLISRPHYTSDGTRLIAWPNAPERVVVSPYAQIIGMGAFCQSQGLREVHYNPISLLIGNHDENYHCAILGNAFAGCANLREVRCRSYVEEMNPRELVRTDDKRAVLVGPGSFRDCRSLERFTPDFDDDVSLSIASIDWDYVNLRTFFPWRSVLDFEDMRPADERNEAFAGCRSLEAVSPVLLGSEGHIRMFAGCESLRSVCLELESCCTISKEMFDGCESLEDVLLVGREGRECSSCSVSVGSRAFNGCRSLTNDGLHLSEIACDSDEDAFEGSRLDIPMEELLDDDDQL